ncbi:MAG: hypothetical protein NW215_04680 [Hyphomicrobiales bacterium]|nr:hypothetical protein [Hyphomicrobiales bacterium]
MSVEVVNVKTKEQFRTKLAQYARDGFITIRDSGDSLTLSRKKKFNWIVAIICLFIPVIGWIALVMMIIAAGRGSRVVELNLVQA